MKNLILFSLIVCLFIPVAAQDVELVQLKANVARVDLTPPLELKYSLGGYGARMSKPAQGIHDLIWIKALVISDNQKKYALITMDMLALPPNIKPQVLEELGTSGWGIDNMMILPSHSHTTLDMSAVNDKNILNNPYIGIYQPKLREFVVNSIVKAVKQADTDLKPVSIATNRMIVDKLNRNRRGDAAIDRDLTVTRIDQVDGKPLVVLVNWTAHPTIMSDEDMYVSGGWPGYLQRELEAWIGNGVICMYYNGAEGDQSVISSKAGSHYEQAEIYGRTIAKKTFELYQKIKPAAKTLFSYKSVLASLPEPQMHAQFMNTGGTEYGIDKKTEQIILGVMCPAKTNIGALRLGDLLIVGTPGEMTYVLGDRIKYQLVEKGARYPVIGGMANEWISYILTKEQYNNAGYEVSVSFYGPELGPTISQAMIEAALPLVK